MDNKRQLMTGAEVCVQAAFDAEAKMMYGYPITPATEVFTGWIKRGGAYLQTEDEIAAGFAVCGGVLAGQKAFSATSGPGHILMQDAMSMAEGMRLPFVLVVGQRGGPSSGTVIYSQQEVILSCFGGNGEGLRFVYSPSSLKELYELTRKAFNDAWQYRFPAIVLTDGYMLKTKGVIELTSDEGNMSLRGTRPGDEAISGNHNDIIQNIPAHQLVPEDKVIHWQNIYTFEDDLYYEINSAKEDFHKIAPEIAKSEEYLTDEAEVLLVAHGIVGSVVKEAVEQLRKNGVKAGLFRPITLRPFPKKQLDKVCGWESVKKVVVIESALGQLARVVRDQLAPEIDVSFEYLQKPGMGIEVEEVVDHIVDLTKKL